MCVRGKGEGGSTSLPATILLPRVVLVKVLFSVFVLENNWDSIDLSNDNYITNELRPSR